MKWFIVIARLEWDDEDSLHVLQAESWESAILMVEAKMRSDDGEDIGQLSDLAVTLERGELYDETRKEFYVNYVVETTEKPVTVINNAGLGF